MLEVDNNGKNSFYIGYTSDLRKRIEQHKSGKGARYTKGQKKIIKLAYTEKFSSRSEAMRREIELKKLKKIDKMNLLKNYNFTPSEYYKEE